MSNVFYFLCYKEVSKYLCQIFCNNTESSIDPSTVTEHKLAQQELCQDSYSVCCIKNKCMLQHCSLQTCNKLRHFLKAWWNTAILHISDPTYTCQVPSAVPYLSDGKRKEENQVQLPPPNADVYQAVCLYLHLRSAEGMSRHHPYWNKDTTHSCFINHHIHRLTESYIIHSCGKL